MFLIRLSILMFVLFDLAVACHYASKDRTVWDDRLLVRFWPGAYRPTGFTKFGLKEEAFMGYVILVLFLGFKILEGVIFVGLVGAIYGSLLLQSLVVAGLVVETMAILHICVEFQKLKEFVSACGAIGIFGTVDKTKIY